MSARVLPAAAAAWLVLYLLLYAWVIRSQTGDVASWYVVLTLLALLACVAAAAGVAPRTTTTAALVLTGMATVAGLLSTGLLLLPADLALAALLAVGSTPARRVA